MVKAPPEVRALSVMLVPDPPDPPQLLFWSAR
jgi:hypothetical protein